MHVLTPIDSSSSALALDIPYSIESIRPYLVDTYYTQTVKITSVVSSTEVTTPMNTSIDNNDKEEAAGVPATNTTSIPPRIQVYAQDSVAYITVSDPVEYNEGALKGKYTSYSVKYDPPLPQKEDTEAIKQLFPYPTSVNRRYSDFSWLYDHLHKERPGSIVPPLPDKVQTGRFSESFIEDRRFHLEIFLRRVVCSEELKDTECLLVFIGGGDAEFKKAKKDGSFGTKDNSMNQTLSDDYRDDSDAMEMNDPNSLVDKGKEQLSEKKKGIKRWLKERKTSLKGTIVRSPDDGIFEQVTHFINALEAGLKRIEKEASASSKRDKANAASLLEFGLGCDALAHIDDEVNTTEESESSNGIGETFRLIGKTSDQTSAISSEHHTRELSCFVEPLRDHLKMVHAVKIALSKRNNRRITYSTCLNAIDSKKASLHKYRINQDSVKALGVESSLSRAETAVVVAKANYEEVSARVLREVDRFRQENAVTMYATMAEFTKIQKEYHEKMLSAWNDVLPQVAACDATYFNGRSFAKAAEELVGRSSVVSTGTDSVEVVASEVNNMSMPSYPPPPEPNNGSNSLNGVVRYRETLPEE